MSLAEILNRERKPEVYNDDIRVIRNYIEYSNDNKALKYMIYELEMMDKTGELRHFYKAIKLSRIIRLPKSAKESLTFMEVHSQVLTGIWEQGINFITLIANMIDPVPLGLMFMYGIQGVAEDLDMAKRIADNDYAALVGLLQGTYRTLEFRPLEYDEVEWLREKMYGMNHLSVVRGLPKAKDGGVDRGNRGIGGSNINPESQDTTEEFIAGMSDREYVIQILSTPVAEPALRDWLSKTAKAMTRWQSQLQGQKAMNFGISLPMMYMANLGASDGWSHSYSDAENVGHARSHTEGTSFTESVSNSQSFSSSSSVGRSFSVGENVSQSEGVGTSQGVGSSQGIGQSASITASEGENASSSVGRTEGTSYGYNEGENSSSSHGKGTNESFGTNQSHSTSNSVTNSESTGSSRSVSSSSSQSTSQSTGHSSTSTHGSSSSSGTSSGHTSGANYGAGVFGVNAGKNEGHMAGSSNSVGTSQSMSSGTTTGRSVSSGTTTGESFGTTNTVSQGTSQGVTDSMGTSASKGTSENWSESSGVSRGQSFGSSASDSVTNSRGVSSSSGWSKGISANESVSSNQGVSTSNSASRGASVTEGSSYSHSQSTSVGRTQGYSKGTSTSDGTTDSWGRSQGTSLGSSGTFSQGTSATMGVGPSLSYSKSFQWLDQEVQNIVTLLEFQNNRLMSALNGSGAFFTDIYIATPDEETKSAAKSLAKSAWHNEEALICPLQVMDLTEEEQSHLLYHFNAFSADTSLEGIAGDIESYRYSTILLPNEYTAYTHLPRISEGGIFADVGDIPKFAVPSMRKGEIYMGKILSGERWTQKWGYVTPFDFRLESDEIMHGFFTGESRSGKTVAATRFIAELANKVRRNDGKRMRIVCMDPKQDWRILAKFVEPERFHFYSLGNPEFLPINLNICKIPRNVYPQQWIDSLIEIYCRAYGLGERGKSVLSETFFELYEKAGVFVPNWREVSPERSAQVTLPKIYKRMMQIKVDLEDPKVSGKGRVGNDVRDAYARVLDRLQVFGREFSIETQLFGKDDGLGIDDLIGKDDVVVLESYGLESTFKNFIFGVVTSGFFKYAQAHEGGFKAKDQYETILVIEEANEVLTGQDSADSQGGSPMQGQSEFEKILDQSAGLGMFIFSITQKIASMPSSVIANSGLVFAGKISRQEDVSVVIRKIGREERLDDRELVKWFPRSPIGWFVCRSSRNFDFKEVEPVLVKIEPLDVDTPQNEELLRIMAVKEALKYKA